METVRRLVQTQQWTQALKLLREMALTSRDPDAFLHLSYAESKCGSHAAAERAALHLLDAGPLTTPLTLQAMSRMRHFNLSEPLRTLIGSLDRHSLTAAQHHAVGAHLSFLGEQRDASGWLDACLAAEPRNQKARLARGQIRMFAGDFESAAADLETCVHADPRNAQAWWSLAQLGTATCAHRNVEDLETTLGTMRPGTPEHAYLAYALHKIRDDLGDIARAAAHLQSACCSRRIEQPYDGRAQHDLLDALMAADQRPSAAHPVPAAPFTPVFIVGMFRSGTTLLEQLISAHPDVASAGELRDVCTALQYETDHHCRTLVDATVVSRMGRVRSERVGQRYLDGVAWRAHGHRVLTDKMPANFMLVGEILRAMPQARILHMVRDPMATCFSNLRELFSGVSPYSYDQIELADFFIKYREVMATWHARYPGRILDVSYADLTRDTERVMREVAAFCDLGFVSAMTDTRQGRSAVATASVVQVRGAVQARKVEKWVAYADYLSPMRERLGAALPDVAAT